MAQRPFNLLRAVFWLLAVVMLLEVLATIVSGVLCWVMNVLTVQQIGACGPTAEVIREVWQELLTGIFALLVAARGVTPPDDKDGGKPDE